MNSLERNKIYDSNFLTIFFIENKKLLEIIYKHTEIHEDEFKNELLNFLNLLNEYKAVKTLWDLSMFEFTIDPQLQSWIDENVNKAEFEFGVLKEAFIVPGDFITQLSIEQTMEEPHGQKLTIKYFSKKEDAYNWLFS
jgi:hypothetical protein